MNRILSLCVHLYHQLTVTGICCFFILVGLCVFRQCEGSHWCWMDSSGYGQIQLSWVLCHGTHGCFQRGCELHEMKRKKWMCVHFFLRGSIAVKLCNEKKRKDIISCFTPIKRNAIFIESTIFIINFSNLTSLTSRPSNKMILTHQHPNTHINSSTESKSLCV